VLELNNKPVAVLISDIHFTIPTLKLATESLSEALKKSEELGVPLVIAGDTLDSKAIVRGECMNALIKLLNRGPYPLVQKVYMLVGNHDLINEKGKEHVLNFLKPYVTVVDAPIYAEDIQSWLVPYTHDKDELSQFLATVPPGSRLIMHQGVQTADMGHYVKDDSSLPKEAFKDFRVISGHYHNAQHIKCGLHRKGEVGIFSYIGNPYTLSFGEAEHMTKGYNILYEAGVLGTVIIHHLRTHVIVEIEASELELPGANCIMPYIRHDDIVWIKLYGTSIELEKISKKDIGMSLLGHCNFKLDKIARDVRKLEAKTEGLTDEQIFDTLIDNTEEKADTKAYLKSLWRDVLE